MKQNLKGLPKRKPSDERKARLELRVARMKLAQEALRALATPRE